MPAAAKAVTAATTNGQQHGQRMNRKGKPIICFNCNGNHPVLECNDIILKERKVIMSDKNSKWSKTASECKLAREANN